MRGKDPGIASGELAVAVRVGAAKPWDFTQVSIDRTVAEKNVAYPTDAKLCHRARARLVKMARKVGIDLPQSYKRVGKRSKGGRLAIHAKALPVKPYDGHTLKTVILDIENSIGVTLTRILVDDGYKGHNAPTRHKFKVFTASRKQRMTLAMKPILKHRSEVEPVIAHVKNEHRMERNYLRKEQGDAINPILAAAGYNFRLILKWIRDLLWKIWIWICLGQTPKIA